MGFAINSMTHEQHIEAALSLKGNLESIVRNANSTKKERALIRELTDEIFGKKKAINRNCGNCWGDALVDILIELNIPLTSKPTQMQQKFILKEGKLIMAFGNSHGYTRLKGKQNMSDTEALKELLRIPSSKRAEWLKKMFDSYPADWEAQLSSFTASGEKIIDDGINDDAVVEPVSDPKKIDLNTLSHLELKKFATEKGYSESEWKKKNRNQLIAYLIEKGE